ncbi:MAG: hypothetical protein ACOH5I_16120 [Oligoflexus sp.]
MQTWFELIRQDIIAANDRLTIQDFAILFQSLYWLILAFFPLSGIDKRDRLTALSYVLFLLFSACLLFFAIPGRSTEFSDWNDHLLLFFFLGFIAWWRWHYRKKKRSKIEMKENLDNPFIKQNEV